MKTILTLATLMLLTACGLGTHTEEQADAAYKLLCEGKVEDLRKALEKKPSIANATVMRSNTMLDVIIDTRPIYPNYLETMEVLLEAGADPNADAPHPLRKAIWRRDPESVKLLLKYGADPTAVWEKKKINMIDYAKSYKDKRMDKIFKTWEEQQKKGSS